MRSPLDAELPVPPIERGRILHCRFAVQERRRCTSPGPRPARKSRKLDGIRRQIPRRESYPSNLMPMNFSGRRVGSETRLRVSQPAWRRIHSVRMAEANRIGARVLCRNDKTHFPGIRFSKPIHCEMCFQWFGKPRAPILLVVVVYVTLNTDRFTNGRG